MKQAKKYPAPQISEAVFRGRNSLYNFEVYPMNVQFNEVPAVYIISKRKIDRHGRGHHFLVCIGQTESLVEDIKKHKRGKCVKQLQANTVSVILEDDARKRLEVENDLKSAHTIPCHHDAADAEFILKPVEKAVSPKVKTEAKKNIPPPHNEIPAERSKKSVKKQAEIKAEAKIEAPKPKKAKRNAVENKVEADSEKISPMRKKRTVEKKPEAFKSKNTAEPDKKIENTKIKTKAQKVETQKAEIQKAEVSKAKRARANTGETKIEKKPSGQKIEISKPKKVDQTKTKIEKKPSEPKPVRALKKASVNQIKPKVESKAESSKSKSGAKLKSGAQKIAEAKAGKAKAGNAKTIEPPKKTAKKSEDAKTPKTVNALKTKIDNKAKAKIDNKAQTKIKISAESKTGQKTAETKADANSKTAKPAKIKAPETSKITKPAKVKQAADTGTKAKGKAQAPKSEKPKVKANTKAKISIKSSVKGKENRLKTSSRKRLAF